MDNRVSITLPVGYVALPLSRYDELVKAEQEAETAVARLEALTKPDKVTAERVAAWINGGDEKCNSR